MVFRIFFFLIGYWMAVYGGIVTVAYMNLLTVGLSLKEYLEFTVQRVECYLLPIGIIIITLSVCFPNTCNKQ
jgi:hypothetical protein